MLVLAIFHEPRKTTSSSIPAPTDTSATRESSSNPGTKQETELRVVEYHWQRGEYGNLFIVGTVRNPSDKPYTYAQVTFNLYNKAGEQVGNAWANVNTLEPNGTWKFRAGVIDEHGVYRAELKDLTAF